MRTVYVRLFFSFLHLSGPKYVTVGEEARISAILLGEEGKILSGMAIDFYLVNENSSELLESSFTNSSGDATIFYTPSDAGDFTVKAFYKGDSNHTDSSSIHLLTVLEKQQYFGFILFVLFFVVVFVIGVRMISRRRRSDEI